ncbi:hypothetical protein SISSUDRAFT_1131844 [Sistotremastrum suecicum HHB10207 ss-3]|uniref:DUF6535 domain-containing protein n=1 Tax=Sistotremastrum suecicum HHB10207 ss-3 TaxID=1314776 RepID=A0A165ZM66_9AGAM|nr:hypothetical protein SISSUDRAFT_1131844 [Sistotremastrum suecicum HHB10207 ss-3]
MTETVAAGNPGQPVRTSSRPSVSTQSTAVEQSGPSSQSPRAGQETVFIELLRLVARLNHFLEVNHNTNANGPLFRLGNVHDSAEDCDFEARLDEMAELLEIKDQVSEWRQQMSLELVIGTLFLTVVTGFAAPIVQSWLPGGGGPETPGMNSSPPASLVWVCGIYVLSIACGAVNAVMCVMGIAWAGHLPVEPDRKTPEQRRLTRVKRRESIQGVMSTVICWSYRTLLFCILLFVAGGITEIWVVGLKDAPKYLVVLCGTIGIALAIGGVTTILGTTWHAILHDDSHYNSPWAEQERRLVMRASEWMDSRRTRLLNLFNSWRTIPSSLRRYRYRPGSSRSTGAGSYV